jgi:hypothetical protein
MTSLPTLPKFAFMAAFFAIWLQYKSSQHREIAHKLGKIFRIVNLPSLVLKQFIGFLETCVLCEVEVVRHSVDARYFARALFFLESY